MKRFMIVLLVAAFAMPFLNGCKKGPNDPAISLKSRDARLTATWKLVKIAGTQQSVDGLGDPYTITYAYDGTTYTESQSGSSYSGTGAFEMTIDKDGLVTSKESFTPNGGDANVVNGENNWYWWDNDNSKSSIYIFVYGGNLFSSGLYIVDQLKSKELILNYKYSRNDNGDVYAADIFYTFEAQ